VRGGLDTAEFFADLGAFLAVEESIQMGEVLREKTPRRFSTSDFFGFRFASAPAARSFR
jgi:hypothetical protein